MESLLSKIVVLWFRVFGGQRKKEDVLREFYQGMVLLFSKKKNTGEFFFVGKPITLCYMGNR